MWGGTVDVHAHTHEGPCMGRRVTPSVGRLTLLHEVGVVRSQNDRRMVKTYVNVLVAIKLKLSM